ncbi:hypothetical protein SPSYN_00924 [Sporotomaculum syntrophicum]|uniref:Uncharacterized protein n=1 Tax=Sporotomaculum syntrophicum TaxID=182264 RepID=A0A9D2WRT5_9FIRM|nr:hypothetical protein [Sporotomaculum syntrophicum]KAF1086183.1 hypothetical protein SPSYN_00924 [Sporotomaculum syntrophicum]
MKKVLQITGYILIAVGVIFILIQIPALNEERTDMVYWREAAAEHYDNNLIEQRYLSVRGIYITHVGITLGTSVAVVISGIFFLALAKIIELLTDINSKMKMVLEDDVLELIND